MSTNGLDPQALPLHGGDIVAAAKRYGIPLASWLDLSTGINPESYPLPELPLSAFQQLPYVRDEFVAAVRAYYAKAHFLSVAGTQVAIQALPAVLNADVCHPVLLPHLGYQEHALQWQQLGAATHYYRSDTQRQMQSDINASLQQNPQQHLVVINPNNPTTVAVSPEQLIAWAECLATGCYLIVDEAFIDTTPAESLLNTPRLPDNIVVLRSFGKFFGLAGLRLGFVFGHQSLLNGLASVIGLWQVNGPAQFIATVALQDRVWQSQARQRIFRNSQLTQRLFVPLMPTTQCYSQGLFSIYPLARQEALSRYHALAQHGILTRFVPVNQYEALLRVGSLCADDQQAISKLQQAIAMLTTQGGE